MTNNTFPLVSCIIPTFNRNNLLTRAISSVLSQTYNNLELIIVNNDVTDVKARNTLDSIIEEYNDPRITLYHSTIHANGAAARNIGIQQSHGKYIAFLDDDDEWLPLKIEQQVQFLINNPELSGCACLYSFYKSGKEIKSCLPYTNDNLLFNILCRQKRLMGGSTLLLDRATVVKYSMFDESLPRHQDLQMLADFASHAQIGILNNYLVIIHQDSEGYKTNVQETIAIKKIYLEKMNKYICKFSKADQRHIYCMHNLEVLNQAIKEKNIPVVFIYFFKVGLNIKGYKRFYDTRKKAYTVINR